MLSSCKSIGGSMPYIKNNRQFLDTHLNPITEYITTPGELCYCVFKLMKNLAENDKCFSNMAMIISEIECAKLEFYRRIVAPYEDKKIEENGDVV